MIPNKLKKGDEVRIIAPSRSMSIITQDARDIAQKRFDEMGLKVTFGKHVEETDEFFSSSIKSRVEDIHEAFADKNVKAILTIIGGFNSNQLLRYLDYELIKANPKIFCGYSDITALNNAIYAKTGLVNYSGPHYSTFGMAKGFDYTMEYFKKCLMTDAPFEVLASESWSNDAWYLDQEKRAFVKNDGYLVISPGEAEGTIIGGNIATLYLLQGTEYYPKLDGAILFIEDDYEAQRQHFDRNLQSLIHQPGFSKVKGIVIGRFEKKSDITNDILTKIIKTKAELNNIPVIAGVDFGHTTPMITFPIGGKVKISALNGKVSIKIIEH